MSYLDSFLCAVRLISHFHLRLLAHRSQWTHTFSPLELFIELDWRMKSMATLRSPSMEIRSEFVTNCDWMRIHFAFSRKTRMNIE